MKRATSFVLGLLTLSAPSSAQRYIISTVAGGLKSPVLPAAATSVPMGGAIAMAADVQGNVYFVGSETVFRIGPTGVLDRLAGDGTQGYSGDNGPAIKAQLHSPTSLAVDRYGNLYIADSGNHRVRRVSPEGTITTIAGDGVPRYAPMEKKGEFELQHFNNYGDGGPAVAAEVWAEGVAADISGNVFVSGGGSVRKISPDGTITTVAGKGVVNITLVYDAYTGEGGAAIDAQLNHPSVMATDGEGSLYIADAFRVLKLATDGTVRTVVRNGDPLLFGTWRVDGPGVAAHLSNISGLAADGTGALYIADHSYRGLQKVSSAGAATTIAGSGERLFSGISALAADGVGNLYFGADFRVRKVARDGSLTTVAGNGSPCCFWGDNGAATRAGLGTTGPSFVAVDHIGNLYISEFERIRKVSPSGIITTVGDGLNGSGSPWGLAIDAMENLYEAEALYGLVVKISPSGMVTTLAKTTGGPRNISEHSVLYGVAVDNAGTVFASTSNDGWARIWKVLPTGAVTLVAGGSAGYSGDGEPAIRAQLKRPMGLAADASGNLYIADGSRVRRISSGGIMTTVAGTGEAGFSGDGGPATAARLGDAFGVAVDREGNLFIADEGNHRVRRVSRTGVISTVAGTGVPGYSGDGGSSAGAQLNLPRGIAVDQAGNVYVADSGNNAVRMLKPVK
jgi:sugar lactone lactonase YvrE